MAKKIISRPRKRASTPDIEELRNSLFEAQGVIRAVRGALTSNVACDEDSLQGALSLAARKVDDVAAALELIGGAS